ncbi:putative cation-transporting ATPase 13A4 [Crotalus adamanteus]|uniref:Cation-transporting ATPase n=1 Tax=Crotalus adamanteus TaxID=8729 RepID=A0AAW1BH48_CROAD
MFGYKTHGFRRALCLAGYILSCGGLLLLFHWKPEWDVWANCQPCSLEEADVVLLRTTDEFQICTQKKVTWTHLSAHLKPSSLATDDEEESLLNKVIVKSDFKAQQERLELARAEPLILLPGSAERGGHHQASPVSCWEPKTRQAAWCLLQAWQQRRPPSPHHACCPCLPPQVRSLQVQKIRYTWDFSAQEFRKVGVLEDHHSCLEMHAKFGAGLTSPEQELRREICGPNAIDIEVTPIWKLLIKESFLGGSGYAGPWWAFFRRQNLIAADASFEAVSCLGLPTAHLAAGEHFVFLLPGSLLGTGRTGSLLEFPRGGLPEVSTPAAFSSFCGFRDGNLQFFSSTDPFWLVSQGFSDCCFTSFAPDLGKCPDLACPAVPHCEAPDIPGNLLIVFTL